MQTICYLCGFLAKYGSRTLICRSDFLSSSFVESRALICTLGFLSRALICWFMSLSRSGVLSVLFVTFSIWKQKHHTSPHKIVLFSPAWPNHPFLVPVRMERPFHRETLRAPSFRLNSERSCWNPRQIGRSGTDRPSFESLMLLICSRGLTCCIANQCPHPWMWMKSL